MHGDLPLSLRADGLGLAVRLTPRAAADRIDGVVHGADGRPALAVRLTAPPVEGAANAALIAFLARTLGLRKGDIALRSGTTARTKLLILSGDADAVAAALRRALGRDESSS